MGSSSSQGAEPSPRQKKLAQEAEAQKKLADDLERIENAQTIPLKMNGPQGKFDHNARLKGTLQELIDEVTARFDVPKHFSKDVEMRLSGYKLEPVTKIVREFTELCPVTSWCFFKELSGGCLAGCRTLRLRYKELMKPGRP